MDVKINEDAQFAYLFSSIGPPTTFQNHLTPCFNQHHWGLENCADSRDILVSRDCISEATKITHTHTHTHTHTLQDNTVVGHLPREISRICWYFLQKRHSRIISKITDHWQEAIRHVSGKGLVVPCIYIYIFTGKMAHLERLISLFL